MKINFKRVLVDLDGNALREGDKELLLGKICVSAIVANYMGEQSIPGEEKFARFKLAQKIQLAETDPSTDIPVEDVAKIKELTGKYCSTVALGAVWSALEGN